MTEIALTATRYIDIPEKVVLSTEGKISIQSPASFVASSFKKIFAISFTWKDRGSSKNPERIELL